MRYDARIKGVCALIGRQTGVLLCGSLLYGKKTQSPHARRLALVEKPSIAETGEKSALRTGALFRTDREFVVRIIRGGQDITGLP